MNGAFTAEKINPRANKEYMSEQKEKHLQDTIQD